MAPMGRLDDTGWLHQSVLDAVKGSSPEVVLSILLERQAVYRGILRMVGVPEEDVPTMQELAEEIRVLEREVSES